jgi:hypothetical protein
MQDENDTKIPPPHIMRQRRSKAEVASDKLRMLSGRMPAPFYWRVRQYASNNELSVQVLIYEALLAYMRKAQPEDIERAQSMCTNRDWLMIARTKGGPQ